MKMTGNTILITGATSGIGRALAEAFHDRGNRVIVTGRRQSLLDQITAERPGLIGLTLDLADPSSLPRFSAEIRASFPRLNVLIANAGISRPEDMTADGWDAADAEAIVATNILGVLRVTAAILPLLKGQPNATIMATSSNLAFVPALTSRPTVPARRSCTPGFSRCGISFARSPSKCWSSHRPMCGPNSPARNRRAIRARCRFPPISLRSCNCWSRGSIPAARCWSRAIAPGTGRARRPLRGHLRGYEPELTQRPETSSPGNGYPFPGDQYLTVARA
ncbi:hypothetical protein ABIB66_004163 [Bradyrhizobium sp. F1.13.3]|jgi:hypothetical protein